MSRRLLGLFIVLLFTASAAAQAPQAKPPKAPKKSASEIASMLPTAISGAATSARNCVSATTTSVHPLGWAPQGTRVTVTFSSDFDPIASLSLVQLGGAASDGMHDFDDWVDDDSGGNFEPRIQATTTFAATMVLYVSAYNQGDAGCYFYKVEVQTP